MGKSTSFSTVKSIQNASESKFFIVEQQLDFINHPDGRLCINNHGLTHNLSIRFLLFLSTAASIFKGSCGLKTRVGALNTKESKKSGFREYSRQSAHTALKELEQAGFIRIRGQRLRGNQGIIIDFTAKLLAIAQRKPKLKLVCPPPPREEKENLEKIRQISNRCIKKCATYEHKNTHVKKFETLDSTIIVDTYQDSNSNYLKGHTRARSNVTTRTETSKKLKKQKPRNQNKLKIAKKASKQLHKVLWSALQTAKQNGWTPRQIQAAYYRGWLDLFEPDYLDETGIEWTHLQNKWEDAGKYGRDELARTQILPSLVDKKLKPISKGLLPKQKASEDNYEMDLDLKNSKDRIKNYVQNGEITKEEGIEMYSAMQNLCNQRKML